MAAKNMKDIAAVIKGMRFHKKIIGGVDERDVWKQLEMLQNEYRSAYEAQRERYKMLVRERDAQIEGLEEQLEAAGVNADG